MWSNSKYIKNILKQILYFYIGLGMGPEIYVMFN